MKKNFLVTAFLISQLLNAQGYGKISIVNNLQVPFLVSLNGIRQTNEFNTFSSYNYVEDTVCKVKVWLVNNPIPLIFVVQNTIAYESTYQLIRDATSGYKLILMSKVPISNIIIGGVPPQLDNLPSVLMKEMGTSQFNEKYTILKSVNFDDNKFEKAKFMFDNEYLSSAQVATLVKLFSFDAKKVEFAKFAYFRVVDKNNFYKVLEVLKYEKDKRELQEWVQSIK